MRARIDNDGPLRVPHDPGEAAGFASGDDSIEILGACPEPRLEYRNGLLVAVTDAPGQVSQREINVLVEQIRLEPLQRVLAALGPTDD